MTKKKTLQIIDEKFNALAGYRGAESCLGNVLAIVAGAKLNAGQVQEIREQLDGIKWRLVELEKTSRIQPAPRRPSDEKHRAQLLRQLPALSPGRGLPQTRVPLLRPKLRQAPRLPAMPQLRHKGDPRK